MSLTSTFSLVSHTTEFQGNSFATGNQILPDVTGLSSGGFVLAYNNAANGEIRVDFYNAAHERVGTFRIPDDGDSEAMGQPQVVELANGNVLVVWDDHEAGDAGPKGRLYSAEGAPIGDEINLTPGVAASGVDHDIQVAALGNGGFVVTHTVAGNIYQTRYTSDGIGIDGGSFQVNSGLPGDQVDSAVAALSYGGYVVTYTDTDPADQTIRARIYNANGTTHVHDFIVGSIGDNTQSKVIGLEGGNWAVVYTDTGWSGLDGGNSAITLQIFDGNGENITPGSYIRVNDPSSQFETEPDIMVLENGFIAVSWTKQIDGADFDIKARVFTPEGVAVTGELNITTSFDTDVKSAVASLLSGKFVTAWQDSTTDGSGGQITAEVNEIVRTTTGDSSIDVFTGDALRDVVDAGGGADTLDGAGGNDFLNGGAGADTMTGGFGNDTFVVDNVGDKVIEANGIGTGTDTVRTTVGYSVVSQFVENMELLGTGSISAIGNNLANTITGNSGNNAIDGRGGIDVMEGGLGNDTYYVDNVLDKTIEANVVGTDTVYASVSKAFVDQFVEVIRLSGSEKINTTGNNLDNTIVGNGANNAMNGRGGDDTMTGGDGNDSFVFNTALGGGNIDIITDFKPVDDTIQLDDAIFTALAPGALSANAFRSNATGLAQDADDRIIYNSANGQIYYDSNGNAAGGNFLFADLDSGLAVTNADFLIV